MSEAGDGVSEDLTSAKCSHAEGDKPAGNVFSIAPGAAFLKVLARELVEGRLIAGFAPIHDPLLLPLATIYLPTRRAARALAAEIIDAMGTKAALLPAIRTFGDGEDDEADDTGADNLAPAISELEQRLNLARLVRGWTTALAQSTRELLGDEDIAIPSSAAEAVRLAADLSQLMESMATEEIDWDTLPALVGDDADEGRSHQWAEWWNLTLHFLTIVTTQWPEFLAAKQMLGPAQRRRLILDLRTSRYSREGSAGPVIAAGSTGSIPATARLIKAVAGLANGAVVLPGLDHQLDADVWNGLGQPDLADETASLCTHPQYGLARLLRVINVPREQVRQIGHSKLAPRMKMITRAMLPAAATGRWSDKSGNEIPAVNDIALIEAASDRLEALAIAVALREALETPGKCAALVTPDRVLARRVAAELGRFGIAVDDSGGTPPGTCAPVVLARLVLSACSQPPDPVTLAALLKHFAVSGECTGAGARHARLFELMVLRDAIAVPEPGNLATAVGEARQRLDGDRHASAKLLSAEWEAIEALGLRCDLALAPLIAIGMNKPAIGIAGLFSALRQTLAGILPDATASALFSQPGGSELLALFEYFSSMDDTGFTCEPLEFCDVFDALLSGQTVRDSRLHHPRLAILGPLEARLQHFDRVILGGLNEGVWPAQTRNDPFLNRPMKAGIGLSTPERRIGQAAHDFQQLSGQAELVYSRSLRSGNTPTIASRWLQRLLVLASESSSKSMQLSGQRFVAIAEAIDRPKANVPRLQRPNPKPPVALRPTSLSVTEIETWIRDPYAIHAKHILRLRPLAPLERAADPQLRGKLYHDILARFVGEPESAGKPQERLAAIAGEVFAANNLPKEVAASWMPRFLAIGALFIEWETGRRALVRSSHCEISGRLLVGDTGFTLRGRADRIDVMRDGTLTILDYKTGSGPTKKQARNLSPQLALETRMAELGGFDLPKGKSVSKIAYVRLRNADSLQIDLIGEGKDAIEPSQLAASAWAELARLISAFKQQERGYLSRHAPSREGDVSGDYDHLSRVREWAFGEDGDEQD